MRRLAVLLIASTLHAQPWSGIVATSRAADWTKSGATIATRTTQCGSTIAAYSGNANAINTAINACPDGQYVHLGTGSFNLSTGIQFGKGNVTLRGDGPDATRLLFSNGTGCVTDTALICAQGPSGINPQPPTNTANWTAGYSVGTTSITLDAKANLTVGQLIFLDQLNNGMSDTATLKICAHGPGDGSGPYCSTEGDSGIDRIGRAQVQAVTVTSISAGSCPCTIGISPALHQTNWNTNTGTARSPGAWWMNDYISGVGVEGLSVENSGTIGGSNINFGNAYNSWIKNIRSLRADRAHVLLYGTLNITIRDSYFWGTQNAANYSYGIETDIVSDPLIENNISNHVTSFQTMGQATTRAVFAYNYNVDSFYCDDGAPFGWMQGGSYHHTAGIQYTLFEGNINTGFIADDIHGTAHFMTGFRNRWQGYDPAGCSVGGKDAQTIAVNIYANNRFFNVIGNVLGDIRRPQVAYENAPTGTTGSAANPDQAVYMLGWSSNADTDANVPSDVLVKNTLMRWGNWDTVNAGSRFVSGEVPSGLSDYPNSVPSNNTLPESFYTSCSAMASWRGSPYGSPPCPNIGPDVTGGDTSDVGGHVYKNTAQLCFENAPIDTSISTGLPITGGSYSGGVATMTVSNSYTAGNSITVRGVSPAGYNGTFGITARTSTTISYNLPSNPGAYSSGGNAYKDIVIAFNANNCYTTASASAPSSKLIGRIKGVSKLQ